MSYKITRHIFLKGDAKNKTTITLTDNMLAGCEEAIRATGSAKSIPDLVTKVLEQFLVQMVHDGVIEVPKGEEENYKAIVASLQRDASKPEAS